MIRRWVKSAAGEVAHHAGMLPYYGIVLLDRFVRRVIYRETPGPSEAQQQMQAMYRTPIPRPAPKKGQKWYELVGVPDTTLTHTTPNEVLPELRRINNPNNEPTGDYTGRCQFCGSDDLWDDNLAYGCNCCGAFLRSN